MDITTLLENAELRAHWTESAALRSANELATRLDAQIDWDRDSGERWARLIQDRHVLAMVRSDLALIMSLRRVSIKAEAIGANAEILVVPSFDDVILQADPEVLERLFPRILASPAMDPKGFSAFDFWYATTPQ